MSQALQSVVSDITLEPDLYPSYYTIYNELDDDQLLQTLLSKQLNNEAREAIEAILGEREMIKISIVEGHQGAQVRNTKNGPRYYQLAYAHLGGAFPSQFEIAIDNPANCYAIGEYTINPACFRIGKWNRLEINDFDFNLIPWQTFVDSLQVETKKPTQLKPATGSN